MTPSDWIKLLGANMGVVGSLFFLLYIGVIPSPILTRIEAHDVSTHIAMGEQVKVVKLQCAILAHMAKLPVQNCYYPPEGPPRYRTESKEDSPTERPQRHGDRAERP